MSLSDDDKVITEKLESGHLKPDLPVDMPVYVSTDQTHETFNHEEDREKIFNLLLTTSIIASEQLSKQDDVDSTRCSAVMKAENEDSTVADEECASQKRLNHFIHNMNKLSRTLSDTGNVDSNPFNRTSSTDDLNASGNSIGGPTFENVRYKDSLDAEEDPELESAFENMKIHALEILFSSVTLDSIRNDTNDELHEPGNESPTFSPSKAFQIDEKTKLELREILQENTKLLKKVNQSYTSHESSVDFREGIDDSKDDEYCAEVENSTNVNYSPASTFISNEIEILEGKSDELLVHCDSVDLTSNTATELLSKKFVAKSGSDGQKKSVIEKYDECFSDCSSNPNYIIETDFLCDESYSHNNAEINDKPLKLLENSLSGMMYLSSSLDKDFDCKTSPFNSSLDNLKIEINDENDGDPKRLPRQKHKSLDSLNTVSYTHLTLPTIYSV